MRKGQVEKDSLIPWPAMNGGAISGNVNHTRKSSRCNEDVLWEILLEMSNRQLDRPRLKEQI